MSAPFLRIGTRGSALALWQAHAVRDALAAAHGVGADEIEVVTIRTTGDKVRDRLLAEIGGKGLFTQEIEARLAEGGIDLAVHSAKDVPTFLPDGLTLAACLPREDPRDVLVAPRHRTIAALPQGARIGTASARREALIRHLRPDLRVELMRGNVGTRLRKTESGEVDATLLALAGLKRLGLSERATEVLEPDRFPPALGQGTVTIEARADDARTAGLLAAIDHSDTSVALAAERALLSVLDGSCRSPIAGRLSIADGRAALVAAVIAPDGSAAWHARREGAPADAVAMGLDAGHELRAAVPPGVLDHPG